MKNTLYRKMHYMLYVIILLFFAIKKSHATEINFSGNLVHGNCRLVTQSIDVDFGSVTNKDFLGSNTGPEKTFSIEFEGCQIGKSVSINFTGTPASAPGLYGAISLSSGALVDKLGIVLVEYTTSGRKEIEFTGNVQSSEQSVVSEQQKLRFGSYLKGADSIVSGSQPLPAGEFNAIVNFILTYE